MKRLLVACTFAAACASQPPAARDVPNEVRLSDDLQVRALTKQVWLHVSWKDWKGTPVASNGLLVNAAAGVYLIDTPWTEDQTKRLETWVRATFAKDITALVVTHAHEDRMGGIAALPNASTYGHRLTAPLAVKAGWPAPATLFDDAATLNIAGDNVEVYFPGAGHTPDNIVVWLPQHRILFGGCFVKPQAAQNLGNLADADVPSWDRALTTIIQRFPTRTTVVPGHGDVGGVQLLSHTQDLVRAKLAEAR
jgi:metallo-beta-lactamase class B